MNTRTKSLLFGGAILAAGIVHTANAEITYGGYIHVGYSYSGYASGASFSYSVNTIQISGNQNGIQGYSDYFYFNLSELEIASTENVTWLFESEGGHFYGGSTDSITLVDQTSGDSLTFGSGTEVTLLANHTYLLEGTFYPDYDYINFSFGAVPAPGALALLGVAGASARRRRR